MINRFWFVGLEGVTRKVRLPIGGPILIGRGAYNHIVLKDSRISRQHTRLTPEAEGIVVYDLNSTNGTFVNGDQVMRKVVSVGDHVAIGPFPFQIERVAEDEGADKMDLERPTLRDLGSVSKMIATRDGRESSAALPVVDLGQLEDAHEKLGTLYQFVQVISKTIDRRELLDLIGTQLREVFPIAKSVGIYLLNRDTSGVFRLAHFIGTGESNEPPTLPLEVGLRILEARTSILDVPESAFGPASGGGAMYAPLIEKNETLGVVHVVSAPRSTGFTRADLDLLNSMSAAAAMMIENTRMHEESLKRDRLNYDLELAAQIQKSFLPREVLSVEGVELFAEYRAAYSVGGDFYDVFWIEEQVKLGVFIGDIAGKGVAGALLMARISSELRTLALAYGDPIVVFQRMNRALLARHQPELFFTAIYLTIDVKTGFIELANAGHPTPYLCTLDGGVYPISEGAAVPIGVLEDPAFAVTQLQLSDGDSLVLHTDGVIEATDGDGEMYGEERLEACLALSDRQAQSIAESIVKSVRQHTHDAPFSDDLTLFIVHRQMGRKSLQPRRRASGSISAPDLDQIKARINSSKPPKITG